MIVTEFDHFKNVVLKGLDWDLHEFKLALFTTAPPLTATAFSELTDELVDPSYPAGGVALTTPLTVDMGQVLADEVVFPELTGTFQYVVLYSTSTASGVTAPCLVLYDLESPLAVTAMTWTFAWTGSIIYELSS